MDPGFPVEGGGGQWPSGEALSLYFAKISKTKEHESKTICEGEGRGEPKWMTVIVRSFAKDSEALPLLLFESSEYHSYPSVKCSLDLLYIKCNSTV